MAIVRLNGIRKRFASAADTLCGIDLLVEDGEFMVFVGPSGCGKSTLLRIIAGLESASEGDLYIGESRANDIPPAKRGVAMVFQNYALYPHKSVAENMGFSLQMAKMPAAHIREQVGRAAEILKISHLLERMPKELSGGQRQRVAIGRAIVRKPDVFLFDEPLSNLDAGLRVEMRVELSKLHKELGSTMIYVTHDQTEAMTMGDRIAVFNAGKIEQVGAPLEVYQQPQTSFVARFLGSPPMNLLPAELVALRWADDIDLKRCVQCGVRPEDWQFCAPDDAQGLELSVDLIEHLGDVTLVYVHIADSNATLCLKLASSHGGLSVGMRLRMKPAPGALHLFDAHGRNLANV